MYKIATIALLGTTSGTRLRSVFLPVEMNEDGNLVSLDTEPITPTLTKISPL